MPFTAVAPGVGLTGWAAESVDGVPQLTPFALDADAGPPLSFASLGLPVDRPSHGMFALDGGGLLVTGHDVLNLTALWGALLWPSDAGLTPVGGPWESGAGNQAAPVELTGAPWPDLALLTNDATGDVPFSLQFFAAQPDGASPWAAHPAWSVDLSTYFGGGIAQDVNDGLTPSRFTRAACATTWPPGTASASWASAARRSTSR